VAEPFLSEIRVFSFEFAPKGWALCNGQLLPINQNQALFSLLGTTYGGDGRVNFGLPDLRGRVPIHMGGGHTLGERGGEQAHTASASSANGNQSFASGNVLAAAGNLYSGPSNLTTLNPTSVANVGGSQAHETMQPFLTLNLCIALQGIFPSQN
jgi:microcystin-dependent protein